MTFTLTLDMSNDAFGSTSASRAVELSLILGDVRRDLQNGQRDGRCRDTNGNTVGTWEITR